MSDDDWDGCTGAVDFHDQGEARSDDNLSTARPRSEDSDDEGQPDIKCHFLNGLGGAHLHTNDFGRA